MKVGVVFPQTEIGPDPGAVRAYAEAAEGLGYNHLAVFDHVLGASRRTRPEWSGAYDIDSLFHEPFVLFGYLGAITRTLELVTDIIILPQRQTALVAKQAAAVDVLSGGRLRLGVGLGWNAVEYEALGQDFRTRGKRIEEQIALMRELWTRKEVTFTGRWDRLDAAGINPLPVQQPIPVWMGGGRVDVALRRIARLADGWFPQFLAGGPGESAIERFHGYVREAGRDPAKVGIEARVNIEDTPVAQWGDAVRKWRDLGATHIAINTMRGKLTSPQAHIDAITRFKEVADAALA